jgi:hypothetical protein
MNFEPYISRMSSYLFCVHTCETSTRSLLWTSYMFYFLSFWISDREQETGMVWYHKSKAGRLSLYRLKVHIWASELSSLCLFTGLILKCFSNDFWCALDDLNCSNTHVASILQVSFHEKPCWKNRKWMSANFVCNDFKEAEKKSTHQEWGPGNLYAATPRVESAILQLELYIFLERESSLR